MKMYYIAVLPPPRINDQVLKWKEWVKTNTGAEKAMNSPGHITLLPPFRMTGETEQNLLQSLDEFAETQERFLIQVKDFSRFEKRTIYLDVKHSEKLDKLREQLFQFLKVKEFPIPNIESGFSPHITIVSRDLKRADFSKVWDNFSETKYEAEFECNSISLLRHNGKSWDVIHTAVFRG